MKRVLKEQEKEREERGALEVSGKSAERLHFRWDRNERGQTQGQAEDEVVRLRQWSVPQTPPPLLGLGAGRDMKAPPRLAGLCSRILSFGRGGEMRSPFSQYSAS